MCDNVHVSQKWLHGCLFILYYLFMGKNTEWAQVKVSQILPTVEESVTGQLGWAECCRWLDMDSIKKSPVQCGSHLLWLMCLFVWLCALFLPGCNALHMLDFRSVSSLKQHFGDSGGDWSTAQHTHEPHIESVKIKDWYTPVKHLAPFRMDHSKKLGPFTSVLQSSIWLF